MSRLSFCALMLLALSCAAPYETVGPRYAPPPPRVVFVEQPSYVVVPGTAVYVVENSNYDVFRYGESLYLSSGGFWYRSRGYGQPFRVVDVRNVPRSVLMVPGDRWKNRSAYSRHELRGRHRDRDRDRDRDD